MENNAIFPNLTSTPPPNINTTIQNKYPKFSVKTKH